jgi:hypothetical protein
MPREMTFEKKHCELSVARDAVELDIDFDRILKTDASEN